MAEDLTQTQDQGGEGWQRAKEASLQHGKAPLEVPGYEVERCLGQGAYGEVWVATDRNNPGRSKLQPGNDNGAVDGDRCQQPHGDVQFHGDDQRQPEPDDQLREQPAEP